MRTDLLHKREDVLVRQTLVFKVHMEKQEMEMKRKLEMETGNGNWKRKLNKNAPITGAIHSVN